MSGDWGRTVWDDMPPGVEVNDGLNFSAFPGLGGGGGGGGGMHMPGTPYPRQGPPPAWPGNGGFHFPQSAPGAFHHPSLPHPSQMPQWGGGGAPTPVTPARDDGFLSLGWRQPEYDRPSSMYDSYAGGFGGFGGHPPPPMSAPALGGGGGGSYFANNIEPLSHSGQPVTSASYFSHPNAAAGRSHSRPRAHSQSRHEWGDRAGSSSGRRWPDEELRHDWPAYNDNNSSYFSRPHEEEDEDEEEAEMRRARSHLMGRMDQGHHDAEWDLVESFGGMGLSEEPPRRSRSRHRDPALERAREQEREWDRGRKPRKSAMKALQHHQRAGSVDEMLHNYERHQRKSRERDQRLLGPYSPYGGGSMRPLDGHAYNEHDRISRPKEWRYDYSLKPGLFNKLSMSRRRDRSDVMGITDPIKRNPHFLLNRTSSSHPPMLVDLRFPIQSQLQQTHNMSIFPNLRRPPTSIDFAQMATDPPTSHMRFFHQRLPWYIDVVSASAAAHGGHGVGMGVLGLTIYEVLEGVWRELQRPITSRDFYNEEMGTVMSSMTNSPHTPLSPFPGGPPPSPGRGFPGQPPTTARDLVTTAFRTRCKLVGQNLFGDPPMLEIGPGETSEISKGVRRIDWLGMDAEWLWTGIVRKGGMWELKTRRIS